MCNVNDLLHPFLLKAAAFSASAFLFGSVYADSFTVKDTVFEQVGAEYNIDPLLLYSIALVESAVDAPNRRGYLNPSPWTIRADKPFYAATEDEARKELLRLLKTKRSVDVGMLQINTKWHGNRVSRITDLLDPLVNVRIAAQILEEQFRRFPEDAYLAVGNYHSSDSKRARWYARHVFRVYTNLKSSGDQ